MLRKVDLSYKLFLYCVCAMILRKRLVQPFDFLKSSVYAVFKRYSNLGCTYAIVAYK